MKRKALYFALAGISLSATHTFTHAQPTRPDLEEVLVTGSYIAGTPEDAAIPVDVHTSEELSKVGTPSMLSFIKNLNISAGVLGDANQFDGKAQGADAVGSVNLRGLGQQRTLILMNGRRLVNHPFSGSVDTNLLPVAALGRIEVLKDGGAVTYGSDAIAGVVNFITKKDFEGFEVGIDYDAIADSDGDYGINGAYGWVGDSANFLFAVGYQERSRLSVQDRDWGLRSFADNPQGGWSGGGNPTGFLPIGAFPGNSLQYFQDPGCADLGGETLPSTAAAPTIPRCRFEYTPFDNLVDPEERYQVYGEYNMSFGSNLDWHVEGLYSKTELDYFTSPSYLATQNSPVTGSVYLILPNHPAIPNFIAAYPTATTLGAPFGNPNISTAAAFAGNVGIAALTFRPYAIGGNPSYGYDASQTSREYEQYRLSTSLSGSFGNAVSWDVGVTYTNIEATRVGGDTVVSRFQAALMGVGGPNCPGLVAQYDASQGCYTYNPFSTAIPFNAITGQVNPNYDAANNNDIPELNAWMYEEHGVKDTSDAFVVDLVFSGDLPVELSGGNIAWAAGAQYRDTSLERETLSDINNLDIYPCPAAVTTAANPVFTTCAAAGYGDGSGPFFFLGGNTESDLDQDVYAVFGEMKLPILDNLELMVALRFEDYGGETGSTTDPKIAARWQANDWLALRGSYSSTFRAPTVRDLDTNSVTSLQNINNTFRPIDNRGQPDLQPETADTFNLGLILEPGNLYASFDYWVFQMDDTLDVEPLGGMVAELFADNPATPAVDTFCGVAAYAGLQNRFQFNGGPANCGIANVARVSTFTTNGSSRDIDGIDWNVNYTWDLVSGNVISIGTTGTWIHAYDLEDVIVEGIVVEGARNAVGKLNAQTAAHPLPRTKGNVFFEITSGNHNTRLVANYVHRYEDQRFVDEIIDRRTTFDLHYRFVWTTDVLETTLNLSVENLADKDPSFARLDLDYDPFTGNPLGRTIKLGVTTRF